MTISCDSYHEAISCRIDGETHAFAGELIDRHLDECAACRAWERSAYQITRSLRIRSESPVPDLTADIMAATFEVPSSGLPPLIRPAAIVRVTLALVAVSQAVLAIPALLGDDLGAPIHVAHEQGAWGLALAIGLAFAAWRPDKAAAGLPFLGVFVASMATLTLADLAAGRVAASAEVPHLMAGLGLGLLWLESHPPAGLRDLRPVQPGPAAPSRAA